MTAANIRHQYRIHRQQASIRRQRHPMTIATDDNGRSWQPTTMAATAASHEWKATHDGNNNDNSNQQMTTGEQMKNGTPINYKLRHSQQATRRRRKEFVHIRNSRKSQSANGSQVSTLAAVVVAVIPPVGCIRKLVVHIGRPHRRQLSKLIQSVNGSGWLRSSALL